MSDARYYVVGITFGDTTQKDQIAHENIEGALDYAKRNFPKSRFKEVWIENQSLYKVRDVFEDI